MESTGVADKIQISKYTADLIAAAGKSHWTSLREDMVEAKGKGVMHTFWLNSTSSKGSMSPSLRQTGDYKEVEARPEKRINEDALA